ncbi:MAG TPA: ribbon-helix-helix protein, CopG family [Candidatus Acidoferrales bacterium]|nr:ribbon-helix-helix protein, CopG family [Candidatus Acidoferrales bacterium]
MKPALIHLDPEQKNRLARRARRSGRSFSQEVRNAVKLYLEISPENAEELKILAAMANESMDRTIARMDAAIATVDRVLRRRRGKR